MTPIRSFVRGLKAVFFAAVVLLSPQIALANADGGGAPEPLVFTVNAGATQYLQFGITFETGSPEAAHLVSAYRPKIQHEIILLLSTKNVDGLRSLAGKKELVDEMVDLVNHVIHEDHKTGVHDILFTRFLIQ